eukprot:TRINITY_DN1546_c0_g1_i1.p1 TRINITY_DN1546_c0_g1~~TRINITY_DN1546_c0_g1_i1.p1  ORF type:complete len:548 (+),score=72.74 TRINITY_DN1546_c0_g1_i1:118-1761(+)
MSPEAMRFDNESHCEPGLPAESQQQEVHQKGNISFVQEAEAGNAAPAKVDEDGSLAPAVAGKPKASHFFADIFGLGGLANLSFSGLKEHATKAGANFFGIRTNAKTIITLLQEKNVIYGQVETALSNFKWWEAYVNENLALLLAQLEQLGKLDTGNDATDICNEIKKILNDHPDALEDKGGRVALSLIIYYASTNKANDGQKKNLLELVGTLLQAARSHKCKGCIDKLIKVAGAKRWTPLHLAADKGNVEMVTELLKLDKKPLGEMMTVWDNERWKALQYAAGSYGLKEVVTELLNLKAGNGEYVNRMLMVAGWLDRTKLLVDTVWKAVQYPTHSDLTDNIEQLVNAYGSIHCNGCLTEVVSQGQFCNTFLAIVVKPSKSVPSVMDALFKANGQIAKTCLTVKDDSKRSALCLAVDKARRADAEQPARLAIVERIIKAYSSEECNGCLTEDVLKVPSNAKDPSGTTVMHKAMWEPSEKIVDALLTAKGDSLQALLKVENHRGSVLDLAKEWQKKPASDGAHRQATLDGQSKRISEKVIQAAETVGLA